MKVIEKLLEEYAARNPGVSLAEFVGVTEAEMMDYQANGRIPSRIHGLAAEYVDRGPHPPPPEGAPMRAPRQARKP